MLGKEKIDFHSNQLFKSRQAEDGKGVVLDSENPNVML
jgi:hypothetical protein